MRHLFTVGICVLGLFSASACMPRGADTFSQVDYNPKFVPANGDFDFSDGITP